jgi:eukaryotic-like serine/threonine-protein kinase
MPLSTGTKLGTYEVVSAIGAGGMGEVYQAHDSNLRRDVAIKVLPEAFEHDADRLSRFRREAQLLAVLNHSNIATIYGLEQSNGTSYLVMELVSGETLQERVKRDGAVPIEEALAIAKQIAEALEAAHEKGIIHRDLKPANVKVTPEGKVKVLDFGLAKAFAGDTSTEDIGNSPTLSMAATMQGVILGTAAYMSPEQAKGKAVDKRTDIWAFGCVLFELLTGKQTFHGEDVTDILAAVVRAEPEWQALPAATPVKVRDLLRRCLQKDKTLRLRDAGDARIEIHEALTAPSTAVATTAALATKSRREQLAWAVAAVFLFTTIGMGTAAFYLSRVPADIAPTRFFISPPEKESFDSGSDARGFSAGVISPDGRRIAFTAKDASGKILIWVRPLDALSPQALQGTDDAAFPFWSPDSRSIGFFAQGQLKKIDVAGGPPQTLCNAPSGRGGTWNRDGLILFAPDVRSSLFRVASAGGEPVAVTKLPPQLTYHRFPSFLPDGHHFLYFETSGSPETTGVYVGSLDSNESKRLLSADTTALFSAPGELLFVRKGALLRQSFDPKKLELSGDPAPVAEEVASSGGITTGGWGAFSVSENGVLTYRNGPGATGDLQLAWFDRIGKPVETFGMPGAYHGVDVTPDGTRIAVHRHDGKGGDIWLFESARRTMSRFTFDASQDNSAPIWSPDGSRIAYSSLRNGKWGIYQKPANGIGHEELLVESDLPQVPMSWSPGDRSIVYLVYGRNASTDQWVLPLAGDRKPVPFLQSPFREAHSQISPDGKWVAYDSNETGRLEIYVRPFPSGEGKWQISTSGGDFPRWRRDSKELFFMGAISQGKMISVKVNPAGPTFEYGDPIELFDSGYVELGHVGLNYHNYAVSPDGQRFLIPRPVSTGAADAASAPIAVVLNWTAGLKK